MEADFCPMYKNPFLQGRSSIVNQISATREATAEFAVPAQNSTQRLLGQLMLICAASDIVQQGKLLELEVAARVFKREKSSGA